MQIIFDIETIPSQQPDARELVRTSIKPPGTLKRADSIAAWWENEAAAAVEDAYRKQSLDGGLAGEIISIAAVTPDGRQWVRCRAQGEPEAALLNEFINTVEQWTRDDAARILPDSPSAWPMDDHYLVAHNAAFDVPYLWRRCRVRGVPVPGWLPGPMARIGKDCGCTMLLWAGWGNRVSLASLTRALGLPSPKDDLDGSMVFDAWLAGEYERIAEYNLNDALATAEVWHRLQGGAA